mgnify:CR=1 FL=1
MRKNLLFACFMLIMATAVSANAAKPKAGVINTLHAKEYKEMFGKGNTLKCPVVIDISAEWCGWCTKMHPNLEKAAKMYSGKIYFFQINYETDLDLINELGVTGFPTLIYIKPNGKSVMKSGYRTLDELEDTFNDIFFSDKNKEVRQSIRNQVKKINNHAMIDTESWPGTELASWPTTSWPITSWPGTDMASWPTTSDSWPTTSWPSI